MEDVRSLILKELDKAAEEIQANMSSQGVNASGQTSRSLRSEDRGKSLVLVIGGDKSKYGKTAPLETLEIGSRPGLRVRPGRPDWFKSIIHQWTIEKGMVFQNESHRWAVSTIIARNIELRGTGRHRKPIDVYSSVVGRTKAGIQSVIAGDFRTMMRTMIKTI